MVYNFSNFSIKTRLFIGFAIIIALNFVSILLSIRQINVIRNDLENIYMHPLAVSNAVREINGNINAIHRTMKDIVLSESINELNKEVARVNKYDKKIQDAFRIVHERFLGNMQDVNQAHKSYNDWEEIRNEVIFLMKNGQKQEAAKITKSKGAKHIEKLFGHTQTMIDFAQIKADEFYFKNKEKQQRAIRLLIILVIITMITSIVIAVLISRSISLPIKLLIDRIKENLNISNIENKKKNEKNEQTILQQTVDLLEKTMLELEEFNFQLENKVQERTEELIKKEELLNMTGSISKTGGWEIDLQTQELSWTKQTFVIHEVPSDYKPNVQQAINFYDDFSKEKITEAVTEAIESSKPFNLELGIITYRKNKLKVHVLGSIRKNRANEPTHVFGTIQDITEREKAEQNLLNYGKIIENSLNEIYIFRADNLNYIRTNKGARLNIGYDMDELKNMTPIDLNPGFTSDSLRKLLSQLKNEEQNQISYISSHQRKDGSIYPVETFLQKAIFELHQVYVAFTNDISKRVADEKAIKESNKNLQDMIYIASHDLQVPLVSMEGYASELLENYKSSLDDEGVYCLTRLQNNAQRMHKLVLSLLDISRLNTRAVQLSKFDLNETINKIIQDLSLTIEKNKTNIVINKLPNLYADKERIESVFRNLIQNSIIYDGENIIIGCINDIIYVKDDGIGIPRDQLNKIFLPGERLKIKKIDGVGMGLTFCKKVIEQHNGKIWAESEGNGKGSCFKLKLKESIR